MAGVSGERPPPPSPPRPGSGATPSLPPGFSALEPWDRERHRGLGLLPRGRARFAAGLDAIVLSAPELYAAARSLPVAFVAEPGEGVPLPVAVVALERGRNLFVTAQGEWRPGCYEPAWVRAWPFHAVRVASAQAGEREGPRELLVCVDPAGLVPGGEPLLEADGSPSAGWRARADLLRDIDAAREETRSLGRALRDERLLAPFDVQAFVHGAGPHRLTGLLRVDEDRLRALPGRTARVFLRRGWLGLAYAHLVSLGNFGRLVDLQAEAGSAGH